MSGEIFGTLKSIYKGKISIKLKNKILKNTTLPVLNYDAQSWWMTKK